MGHMVASHTWSHTDLTTLSSPDIHDEMRKVETALHRIAGVKPAFMRPPYGSYNDLVRKVSAARGQKLVLWDFDSEDSVGATPAQSNVKYDSLAKEHPRNVLALNHEVYERTAHEVVPHAISVLQAKGYKLVTVAECLGMEPYQSTSAKTQSDSGPWSC
eukprot:GHVR01146152.1.p1 GENE.GHVR01146152.1~~GHVR01146152.1.p1  ORF type:complete len:159 (-),score=1.22 GHVR01146152.1:104-580(-)